MNIAKVLKLVASITLTVCIFLPLSQCRGPVPEDHEGDPPLINNYVYEENMVSEGIESIFRIFSWVLPLILTLLALKFGISIKLSALQLVSAILASLTLLSVLVWSHKALWPAYLAAICIMLLAIFALIELFNGIRKWRLTKPPTAH